MKFLVEILSQYQSIGAEKIIHKKAVIGLSVTNASIFQRSHYPKSVSCGLVNIKDNPLSVSVTK